MHGSSDCFEIRSDDECVKFEQPMIFVNKYQKSGSFRAHLTARAEQLSMSFHGSNCLQAGPLWDRLDRRTNPVPYSIPTHDFHASTIDSSDSLKAIREGIASNRAL